MEKKEEKKQIYEVHIIKNDGNHIIAISTDVYDKAFEKWKESTEVWTKAAKEKIPMVLTNPIVTAFDPGLVREITLRPIMEVPESKYDNPYQKRMINEGLSNTLRNANPLTPDILDGGYR